MAKTIEITAPEYLELDQNFYDQEPYTSIPDSGLNTEQMRMLLSGMADFAEIWGRDLNQLASFGKGLKDASYWVKKERLEHALANFKMVTLDTQIPGIGRAERAHSGLVIARHLRNYPLIWSYTQTQRDRGLYRRDGSVRHADPMFPTETYPYWASRQLDLQNRLVMVGLEEVFPQGTEPERTVDPRVTTGVPNPGSRRWRIVTAAEITRQS